MKSNIEYQRRIKMVQLGKQGNSVRWEVPEKKLSHSHILTTSAAALKFRIKAVHDLLPSPANKNKWHGSNNECTLCGKPGTINHILSGCRVALSQLKVQMAPRSSARRSSKRC